MKLNKLFIFLALAAWSCHKEKKATAVVHKPRSIEFSDSQMKNMKLGKAERMPYAEEINAVGDVSFDENNVVRIFPIVSGTVEEVKVSLGDYVQRGQLLASILSTDVSGFQRDYSVAKENLQAEEKDMYRAEELYKSNMMSAKDYSNAKKEYSNALSEFNERKQILELYGSSSDNLDATYRVIAPRCGFIVQRDLNAGMHIRMDNSATIFIISDLKTVWVWINVHESDMAKVHDGDHVSVTTVTYPGKIFSGVINRMGTTLDPASRVIRSRCELDNSAGLLKPEMFITATITSQTKETVLAVSEQAVVLENNRYYVMRQAKPNEFEKVQVVVGKKFSDMCEVQGLSEGDIVIEEGALFAMTDYNLK